MGWHASLCGSATTLLVAGTLGCQAPVTSQAPVTGSRPPARASALTASPPLRQAAASPERPLGNPADRVPAADTTPSPEEFTGAPRGLAPTAAPRRVDAAAATLLSDMLAPGDSDTPRVAVDGRGTVHVVWADSCSQFGTERCPEAGPANYPGDIFHRTLDAATGTLGPAQLVSDAPGDGNSREPAVATDGDGNLHVVWVESGDVDGKGPDADVVHRILDAATGRWGPLEVLSPTDDDEKTPAIAAAAGVVHVAWDHPVLGVHEVIYTRFEAGSWSAPAVISSQATSLGRTLPDGDARSPALAADAAGCAHAAWQAGGSGTSAATADWDIFYRRLCAGAAGPVVLVSDSARDGESRLPAIAADAAGGAAVAWQDGADLQDSGTDGDIWVRRVGAGGGLGPYALVSRGSDHESFSASVVFTPAGELAVAWSERRPVPAGEDPRAEVFVNLSIAGSGGTAFANGGSARSSLGGAAVQPSLAVDRSGNLHLAWQDRGDTLGAGDDTDVMFQSHAAAP